MTARGFGKRDGEEQEYTESEFSCLESFKLCNFSFLERASDQQVNDDYRDENLNNLIRQKQLLFPFSYQASRTPQAYQDDNAGRENNVIPPVKSHRLQIRDGTLKFRLNDGNLRIGRGFGKRNYGADPYVDKWVSKFYIRRSFSTFKDS